MKTGLYVRNFYQGDYDIFYYYDGKDLMVLDTTSHSNGEIVWCKSMHAEPIGDSFTLVWEF